MKLIVVDDEKNALENMEQVLTQLPEVSQVTLFDNGQAALDYLAHNTAHAALLDIEMRGMGGLELAKRIREIRPDIAIIFVTGYSQYAVDALELHANGYILKPAKAERIRSELQYLQGAPAAAAPVERLRIQCFGNFEAFADGKPVFFKLSRTKELLAYLIDRKGAACTMGQLMAVLWEDKPDSAALRSQLRNLIADLRAALKACNAEDAVVKHRNAIAIDVSRVDCDYYRFLQGDLAAVNRYQGEYMSQYSWPEMTTAALQHK